MISKSIFRKNKIVFLTLFLIIGDIYSEELPTHRREGTIGASLGYQFFNRLPFFRLGKENEYTDQTIGNYNSKYDINIFYNILNIQSLGIRIQNHYNIDRSDNYNYGIDVLGNYEVKSTFPRPNIEVYYKFYIFDTSFYLAPIIGVSSPKDIRLTRTFNYRLDPIKRDYLAPYGLEYNVASRLYGGIDIGYGFTFFENIFMNIGYMVKVAAKPKIKVNYYLGFGDFADYYNDFKIENSVYSQLVYSNINKDIISVGLGSSSLYFELGFVF